MKLLHVNCKSCEKDFTTGFQMDEVSFSTSTVSGAQEQCYHCGNEHTYEQKDFFFK